MRKTVVEVIRLYNETAIAAPDYVWTPRFSNPRMEDAPGSGHVFLEHREMVKGEPEQTEAVRVTINTAAAYEELDRLKRRIRCAERKHEKELSNG